MSTGRLARENYLRRVEIPLLRVAKYPTKSASSVLDRSRSQGVTRHTILDIDNSPAAFEIWQQLINCSLFRTKYPTAAVDKNNGSCRLGIISRIPDIELERRVVSGVISNIRLHPVSVCDAK